MKYFYYTIFADSAAAFTEQLNAKGKDGWALDRFEYREYVHRDKAEGPMVIQSYVGVMVKTSTPDVEVTTSP